MRKCLFLQRELFLPLGRLVNPDRRVLDAWIIGPTSAWLGFRNKQLAFELGAFRPE